MTVEEACERHKGITPAQMQHLCLQGKIRAQKVGKYWHIPVVELDRVFLGVKAKVSG